MRAFDFAASEQLRRPESECALGRCGAWKLAPRHAITLRPRTDGVLLVTCGKVWATLDAPRSSSRRTALDHVLGPEDSLFVRRGQRLVFESWHRDRAAYFAWDPVMSPPRLLGHLRALRVDSAKRFVCACFRHLRSALGISRQSS